MSAQGVRAERWLFALRVSHTAWHHLSHCDKPVSLPGLRHVTDLWFEVPDPLPRVRLVGRTRVSDVPEADIQRIDVTTTALVTHPMNVEDGEPGTVTMTHERPGELYLRVTAPGQRLLVIADSYDPNWMLTIDGAPAAVERVNGDFLGCVVAGGEHEVRFDFRPACIGRGRLLSLAGAVLALLIAGVSCLQMLIRSRRAAGGPARARSGG